MTDLPVLSGNGVFHAREDGLTIRGTPPRESFVGYGEGLARVWRAMPWILGDFFNAWESAYGDEWYQVALNTDEYSVNTIENYMRAARSFPPHRRRIGRVHPSKFVRIAHFEEEEQERLLDQIEQEGLTSNELNQLLSPKPEAIEFETIVPEWSEGLYIRAPSRVPAGKYRVRLTPL